MQGRQRLPVVATVFLFFTVVGVVVDVEVAFLLGDDFCLPRREMRVTLYSSSSSLLLSSSEEYEFDVKVTMAAVAEVAVAEVAVAEAAVAAAVIVFLFLSWARGTLYSSSSSLLLSSSEE